MLSRCLFFNRSANTVFGVMALLLFLVSAVGCNSGPGEGVWLNAPGWRRAQMVAPSTIPDAATVALEGEQALYLFVVDRRGDEDVLRVQRMDRRLNEVWQRELDVPVTRGDQPRAIWNGEQLRLMWLDADGLYTATMDRDGQVRSAPRQLSEEHAVNSFDVAQDGEGRVAVLFGGSVQRPGVYTLPNVADEGASPQLLDEEGFGPQLRADGDGNHHAVWFRHAPGEPDATIYYAHDGEGAFEAGSPVTTFGLSSTAALEGPYLGLDRGSEGTHATVLWSIQERTGLSAGSTTTFYVSFPVGEPQSAPARQPLFVPADYDLDYVGGENSSSLQTGPWVPLPAEGSRVAPQDLWTNEKPEGELVVAARASVAYQLRKEASQSMLIYFDDGEPQGYQLLSFTRSTTVAPYVRSDVQGHLYASWMEPAAESGFVAYLASTAPDVYEAVGKVGVADVGQMVTETIFGMLSGAALAPFVGILWLIAPLVVLGLTSFLRRDDERTINPGSVVSLLLALAAYWAVKVTTLPGFGEYVPFSSWIPFIPGWLEGPLRWGVLLLIAAAALHTAWRFTYRRQAHSALNFMLIHTAVDAVLSMAIYGSIIYGMI